MALSRIVIPGDGVTTTFTVSFALGYISEDDVTCRVGDEQDGSGNPLYRDITWLSPTLATISGAAPGAGVTIIFERTVPRDVLIVDFQDNDIINEDNLNTAQKQSIMMVHEVLDGRQSEFNNDVDMGGFRIKRLGDPVDPQDATNKRYVDEIVKVPQEAIAAVEEVRELRNETEGFKDEAQTAANQVQQALTDIGDFDQHVQDAKAAAVATAADRVVTGANASAANTSALRAEAARDAAAVTANVYPTIAAGRAAVADGQQFSVYSATEIIRYQRTSSTTQIELARYAAGTASDFKPNAPLNGQVAFQPIKDGTVYRRVSGEFRLYDPVQDEAPLRVVRSAAERDNVQYEGNGHKAWPPGRRIYDEGLRSELIADGTFWRLPDGRPADQAHRIPLLPVWDDVRPVLPTYAENYKLLDPAVDIAKWSILSGDAQVFRQTAEKGYPSIRVDNTDGVQPTLLLDYGEPINPYKYFIFDTFIEHCQRTPNQGISNIRFEARSADNTLLFAKTLNSTDMGPGSYAAPISGINHWMVFRDDMNSQVTGADWADVTKLGWRITRVANWSARLWMGAVETVNFRPMVSLRFDDHRLTQYTQAWTRMETFGFKGVMAVMTGAPELGNHPDFATGSGDPRMSRAQLETIRDSGWDLVSHTVTHRSMDDLTFEQLEMEFSEARRYLQQELGVTSIAPYLMIPPRANANLLTTSQAVRYYELIMNTSIRTSPILYEARGWWDRGNNWRKLGSYSGDNKTSAATIAEIETCINRQYWRTITTHDINPTAGPLSMAQADFQAVLEWLDANRSRVDVLTWTQVIDKMRGL